MENLPLHVQHKVERKSHPRRKTPPAEQNAERNAERRDSILSYPGMRPGYFKRDECRMHNFVSALMVIGIVAVIMVMISIACRDPIRIYTNDTWKPKIWQTETTPFSPLIKKLQTEAHVESQNDLDEQRLAKAEKLETDFQKKCHALQEIVDGDINTRLFERCWTGETRTENSIRFCQFNVLCHGMSDFGSGFATSYKAGAPCPVKNIVDEYKEKNPEATKEQLEAVAEKRTDLRQTGKALESWSVSEKKWLHRPEYLELLFCKTWGQKPYGIPERIKRVVGLILKECPDVMTLQELDHFDYFSTLLAPMGYKGEIHKKANEVTRTGNGTYGYDGTAIFWNTEKLERVSSQHVKLHKSEKKLKVTNQRMILVTLRNKLSGKEFAVVSGHFKSGGKNPEMQKYHVQELLKLMESAQGKPIVFACDFNNDSQSDVFKHFQSLTSGDGKVNLESAYDLNDKERFSCVKMRKGGDQSKKVGKVKNLTIDYIFYSKDHWTPKGTLQVPKKDLVLKETNGLGLPCWKYPSDHFMLSADLELN